MAEDVIKRPADVSTSLDDEAVQATNDDAAGCKRSAVHLGYWKDPYLNHFVKGPMQRKSPEINLGYFARTYGVFRMILNSIKRFSLPDIKPAEGGDDKVRIQVINLGAGSDTLYWRLLQSDELPENVRLTTFVDVDFPVTSKKKIQQLINTPELMRLIASEDSDISRSQTELHSQSYHIIGADLRALKELEVKLKACGVSGELPTIFVSECVLVYLDPVSSDHLLKYFSQAFTTSVFINYEQANMNDTFAQVMLRNLELRGCHLNGVAHCKSMDSQMLRFSSSGWDIAYGWTMTEIYSQIPKSEISRIEAIEMLDERELLKQLLDHYCLIVAIRCDTRSIVRIEF